jgi:hypothetical protein
MSLRMRMWLFAALSVIAAVVNGGYSDGPG